MHKLHSGFKKSFVKLGSACPEIKILLEDQVSELARLRGSRKKYIYGRALSPKGWQEAGLWQGNR